MADEKDMSTAESEVADSLKNRDTSTGNLDKFDDTRTRKTIKLRPIGNSPSSSPPVQVQNGNDTLELVADPLNTRHTKTGALHKLVDTRTRKTIKISGGGAKEPVIKLEEVAPVAEGEDTSTAKLERPSRQPGASTLIPIPGASIAKQEEPVVSPVKLAFAVTESEDTSTAKLERPPRQPGAPTLIPIPGQPTVEPEDSVEASPAAEGEDTSTVKVERPSSKKPDDPTLIPRVAPLVTTSSETKSADVPAPSQPLEPKYNDGADTRTRRTIKLAPISVVANHDAKTVELSTHSTASRKLGDTRTRKTIKLGPGVATPKLSAVQSAAESVMPTVAQAKAISPSSQTIKLRPSETGSAAPAPTAAPAPSSRDTIKLKPTAASAAPAQAGADPTSKPSGISLAPKSALSVAAPAPVPSEQGSSLRVASTPGASGTSSAPDESDSQNPSIKNGLMLKKDIDTTRKGPPRAAKEEAEIKSGKKKRVGSSGPSWAFTSFCVLMLLCLLFTAFISAAHYFNTWQPELVEKHLGSRIAVPVLDDQLKNR